MLKVYTKKLSRKLIKAGAIIAEKIKNKFKLKIVNVIKT